MQLELNRLDLPERDYKTVTGSYGDLKTSALYCGLRTTPNYVFGEWQHGWHPPEDNYHPEAVVGSGGTSRLQRTRGRFFVARDDQRDYLISQGYRHVSSIGLPIVYLEKPEIERVRGSLLVMPQHSLATSNERWNGKEYADYITGIADHFTRVTVCIHQTCFEKGNWRDSFKGPGLTIVAGADKKDQNSLLRMATLMSQHEYVTSNCLGSHIPYSCYFGCKASVSGPAPSFDRADLENQTLYINAPRLLDRREERAKQEFVKEHYPQFHCLPWEAKERVQWAEWQLGKQCNKSPQELRRLFGWTLPHRMKHLGKRTVKTGVRELKRDLGWCKTLGPLYGILASIRLQTLIARPRQTGVSRISYGPNRNLALRNGTTDIAVFEQHFLRREILDIKFPLKHPSTILDLGANVGISVAAFRMLFPDAKIVAVELNKESAALCLKNHESDPLVKVVNGAIWSRDGRVGVRDVGTGEWSYQVEPLVPNNSGVSVPAFRFETLLEDNGIDVLDIMKMDIEGAEADVLEASAGSIFARTKVSIIEVHDWIHGVEERVNRVIQRFQSQHDLETQYCGEFLVIVNRDVVRMSP